MQHTLSRRVAMVGVAGLGLLAFAAGPALAKTAKPTAAKGVTITVTAGKPTELAYVLSQYSMIPVGPVTFKVTNVGAVNHSFKICLTSVKTAAANSCTGPVTKYLLTGQSQSITVTLAKGTYEFLCTLPGHAAGGQKGLIGVGVKVPAPAFKTPSITAPGTTAISSTSCANPTDTVVSVLEFEFGFGLSQSSIPCGSVEFDLTNIGQLPHNFEIKGLSGSTGMSPVLQAGETGVMTVSLTPGTYWYACTVADHADLGMYGEFVVTG